MAKTKISEFSSTAASNTDIDNINIAEGCSPSNINNAIRALMSQLKNQQDGSSGDNFSVGGNLTVTGTTTLTTVLPVTSGGTGASTDTGARTALSAAKLGANSDITSLTGLTTPLSVAQGGTGVTAYGTGVSTFLSTPSSANLASAVTDETGSGALVFATSPTLVTPALGTPSALVGTNITGTSTAFNAGIGVNQTWSSPTRVVATVYQNTTGKPILVQAWATGDRVATQLIAGATSTPTLTISYFRQDTGTNSITNTVSGIIPNNWYYKVTISTGSLTAWVELS
jgi:hypothetical protein